jgi:hypothetical protein
LRFVRTGVLGCSRGRIRPFQESTGRATSVCAA